MEVHDCENMVGYNLSLGKSPLSKALEMMEMMMRMEPFILFSKALLGLCFGLCVVRYSTRLISMNTHKSLLSCALSHKAPSIDRVDGVPFEVTLIERRCLGHEICRRQIERLITQSILDCYNQVTEPLKFFFL